MRRNLFWKLALTFLALLLGVLVAVDFFAERALRRDSERATFEQLATIARFAQVRAPVFPSLASAEPENLNVLNRWAAEVGSGGATARSNADAPEIDGTVHVTPTSTMRLKAGEFATVRVTRADIHDLWAEVA